MVEAMGFRVAMLSRVRDFLPAHQRMRERLREAREAAGMTQEAVAKHFKKP